MKRRACPSPIDQRFYDSQVSLTQIIWLAACAADAPDALTEFLESEGEEAVRLFGCSEDTVSDPEFFLEFCFRSNKVGFLVQAQTPIPHDFFTTGGNGYSSSWGYCRSGWFYTTWLDVSFVEELARWQAQIEIEARSDEARKAVRS